MTGLRAARHRFHFLIGSKVIDQSEQIYPNSNSFNQCICNQCILLAFGQILTLFRNYKFINIDCKYIDWSYWNFDKFAPIDRLPWNQLIHTKCLIIKILILKIFVQSLSPLSILYLMLSSEEASELCWSQIRWDPPLVSVILYVVHRKQSHDTTINGMKTS